MCSRDSERFEASSQHGPLNEPSRREPSGLIPDSGEAHCEHAERICALPPFPGRTSTLGDGTTTIPDWLGGSALWEALKLNMVATGVPGT
jgi:hypothetical protein